MDYKKGAKLNEGKTKIVWEVEGRRDLVIIENKNDITAFDDPSFTKQFKTKAEYATTVTSRVFELLKKAGIPVAFEKQISANQFIAPSCQMIPLEVVSRRYAVGSFLKRHPELNNGETFPHRFHKLVIEFFLKTTKGELINYKGTKLLEGLDPKKGEEDPFIENPFENNWNLYHAKKPRWEEGAILKKGVEAKKVLSSGSLNTMKEIDDITRKVFLTLEGAWNVLGYRIIDMKIEFGLDRKGNLMVADVIDNDSWRLRDSQWQELSKEAFRQGEELGEVEKKYGFVAELSQKFRVPEQALVMWRGSDSDEFPDVSQIKKTNSICIEEITLSGHKATNICLERLEKILTKYSDGGVILAFVGMSNGLGPILSARTSWPVIGVAMTVDKFPVDVWSSLRMPSNVPMLSIASSKNAVLAALNILSQKNPVAYMIRQLAIEELDC